jgi:hypothetical protein
MRFHRRIAGTGGRRPAVVGQAAAAKVVVDALAQKAASQIFES